MYGQAVLAGAQELLTGPRQRPLAVRIPYAGSHRPGRVVADESLSNPIRHMNLRGYARFLFFQGKFQLGGSKYEEALQIDLSDTDDNRRIISDTYFTWAEAEQEFGNFSETERLIVLGQSYSNRIGHEKMKEEMQKRFEKF
jgi:hypothetical protein